jgi:hypothetical protein
MKKELNSFNDVLKLNRRELFKINKDKEYILKPLDKKFAVKIARQISEGFNSDLRKTPSKRQYQKARKVIEEFYDGIKVGNVDFIRPKKSNRKAYAKYTGLNDKFKIFPVSRKENDKFRVKKGKVIRSNNFIVQEEFLYDDLDDFDIDGFVENSKPFTGQLIKEAKSVLRKRKDLQFKIICGRHLSNFQTIEEKELTEEVDRYMNTYKDPELWLKGISVFTFKNQK